jgi:lipoprotein-releasing system ATP-binding protein
MTKTKTTAGTVALSARGITKEYIDGTRRLTVLMGVDLDVHQGEFISIVGQSGSGKSTLLHILGALDRPSGGSVRLGEWDYSGVSDRGLASMRSSAVGFIYQFHHLLPEFTALENVLLPGLIVRLPRSAAVEKAESLLRRVGLGDRLDHRPSKLSGGEQQRVALARALLNDPAVVLADEPTGNLDTRTASDALDVLVELTKGEGKSLVMVTHDESIARRADRQFLLKAGKLTAV